MYAECLKRNSFAFVLGINTDGACSTPVSKIFFKSKKVLILRNKNKISTIAFSSVFVFVVLFF